MTAKEQPINYARASYRMGMAFAFQDMLANWQRQEVVVKQIRQFEQAHDAWRESVGLPKIERP